MAEGNAGTRQAAAVGFLVVATVAIPAGAWRAGHPAAMPSDGERPSLGAGPSPSANASANANANALAGPIAAGHLPGGDVVVAAFDGGANAVRLQRIDAHDKVVKERLLFTDAATSGDAEIKLTALAEGIAVTWRGLRGGKLVRELSILSADLVPNGREVETAAAACATKDAFWTSDGASANARAWTGRTSRVALPSDKDAALLCGSHRAFAVLDDDEKAAILPLGEDGGAPSTMMRESEFGEDEQRELAEYTVGDDVGFVRLATSGALALRELGGALHKLKNGIRRDDDVVAVDASPRAVVIVYTEEASSADDAGADTVMVGAACTRVSALRIDRKTFEESFLELAPARCGFELGPFYTNADGDDVVVAWPERSGGAGQPRAPIVSLAHARVTAAAAPSLVRVAAPAVALADAGCEAHACWAVALDQGAVKVLRYF